MLELVAYVKLKLKKWERPGLVVTRLSCNTEPVDKPNNENSSTRWQHLLRPCTGRVSVRSLRAGFFICCGEGRTVGQTSARRAAGQDMAKYAGRGGLLRAAGCGLRAAGRMI